MSDLKRNSDGDVVCQVCGCEGNCKCGHYPPQWALDNGRGCGLNDMLVCPCCTNTGSHRPSEPEANDGSVG